MEAATNVLAKMLFLKTCSLDAKKMQRCKEVSWSFGQIPLKKLQRNLAALKSFLAIWETYNLQLYQKQVLSLMFFMILCYKIQNSYFNHRTQNSYQWPFLALSKILNFQSAS